ncbi:MAG: thiamine diphosphokinase [Holosporales bacterium]|jgi:thiamine pyrophosphokinase|nr:thiamine diphosphokinase [Holosporales bacterium]
MIVRILASVGTYRSILCLDGNLRNLEGIVGKLGLPLIAADGAANQVIALGLNPDLIIGDLDSVNSDLLIRFNYLELADQDTSDFQKALVYLSENALLPSIILGISGGNIDHIINNTNIFLSYDDNIFIDGDIIGMKITGKRIFRQIPINTKLSIFGIPECNVTTSGLKWELKSADLAFATYPHMSNIFGYNSCFNRTVSENFTIEVTAGTALLLIYSSDVVDAGSGLDYAKK